MSRNIVIGGKHEQKRRTAKCTFAVYPQAERAAVYRGVMAREFGVSERTIQDDLSVLEVFGQIKRTPSYNSLHRQNGNIIVYTGSRKRQSHKSNDG